MCQRVDADPFKIFDRLGDLVAFVERIDGFHRLEIPAGLPRTSTTNQSRPMHAGCTCRSLVSSEIPASAL